MDTELPNDRGLFDAETRKRVDKQLIDLGALPASLHITNPRPQDAGASQQADDIFVATKEYVERLLTERQAGTTGPRLMAGDVMPQVTGFVREQIAAKTKPAEVQETREQASVTKTAHPALKNQVDEIFDAVAGYIASRVDPVAARVAALEGAGNMAINVEEGVWGNANASDVKVLLQDTASQLLRHFGPQPFRRIEVKYRQGEPHIAYRNSTHEPYVIGLTIVDRWWNAFAYEFSHELCHLLQDYEKQRAVENHWFRESLCEAASLFCLSQMAQTWKTHAPYNGYWSGYASAFGIYLRAVLDRSPRPKKNFKKFFTIAEPMLRRSGTQRELNYAVAHELFRMLQRSPKHWRAIQFLPDSSAGFQSYLNQWQENCPAAQKAAVTDIGKVFFDA